MVYYAIEYVIRTWSENTVYSEEEMFKVVIPAFLWYIAIFIPVY